MPSATQKMHSVDRTTHSISYGANMNIRLDDNYRQRLSKFLQKVIKKLSKKSRSSPYYDLKKQFEEIKLKLDSPELTLLSANSERKTKQRQFLARLLFEEFVYHDLELDSSALNDVKSLLHTELGYYHQRKFSKDAISDNSELIHKQNQHFLKQHGARILLYCHQLHSNDKTLFHEFETLLRYEESPSIEADDIDECVNTRVNKNAYNALTKALETQGYATYSKANQGKLSNLASKLTIPFTEDSKLRFLKTHFIKKYYLPRNNAEAEIIPLIHKIYKNTAFNNIHRLKDSSDDLEQLVYYLATNADLPESYTKTKTWGNLFPLSGSSRNQSTLERKLTHTFFHYIGKEKHKTADKLINLRVLLRLRFEMIQLLLNHAVEYNRFPSAARRALQEYREFILDTVYKMGRFVYEFNDERSKIFVDNFMHSSSDGYCLPDQDIQNTPTDIIPVKNQISICANFASAFLFKDNQEKIQGMKALVYQLIDYTSANNYKDRSKIPTAFSPNTIPNCAKLIEHYYQGDNACLIELQNEMFDLAMKDPELSNSQRSIIKQAKSFFSLAKKIKNIRDLKNSVFIPRIQNAISSYRYAFAAKTQQQLTGLMREFNVADNEEHIFEYQQLKQTKLRFANLKTIYDHPNTKPIVKEICREYFDQIISFVLINDNEFPILDNIHDAADFFQPNHDHYRLTMSELVDFFIHVPPEANKKLQLAGYITDHIHQLSHNDKMLFLEKLIAYEEDLTKPYSLIPTVIGKIYSNAKSIPVESPDSTEPNISIQGLIARHNAVAIKYEGNSWFKVISSFLRKLLHLKPSKSLRIVPIRADLPTMPDESPDNFGTEPPQKKLSETTNGKSHLNHDAAQQASLELDIPLKELARKHHSNEIRLIRQRTKESIKELSKQDGWKEVYDDVLETITRNFFGAYLLDIASQDREQPIFMRLGTKFIFANPLWNLRSTLINMLHSATVNETPDPYLFTSAHHFEKDHCDIYDIAKYTTAQICSLVFDYASHHNLNLQHDENFRKLFPMYIKERIIRLQPAYQSNFDLVSNIDYILENIYNYANPDLEKSIFNYLRESCDNVPDETFIQCSPTPISFGVLLQKAFAFQSQQYYPSHQNSQRYQFLPPPDKSKTTNTGAKKSVNQFGDPSAESRGWWPFGSQARS